ncbi:MAG TPA: hypothetical protein VGB60_11035 [Brevundimonas sp.]|jgi:hypothetical protein|uniref:hypothetical protein n=1 Tax=Brevundimonas sp. TaxID=1871086 RepID=UPI002ED7C0D5
MLGLLLAGAVLAAPMQAQDPGAAAPLDGPVTLEDVTVTGRPLQTLIRNFVGEVAEPNRGRGLARWDDRVCVGVVNLRVDVAQYLADRISTVAQDLGLETGGDGCNANILIIATADGEAVAASMVEDGKRIFRTGGPGMDRGGVALRDFVETDRPVRWWQVATPVNSETGERAVRIPGECSGSCQSVNDMAPVINVLAASRLNSQIVDELTRTIVIVDIDEVEGMSSLQLADYIAMVSLAQIDPGADTSAYATILNVMADPQGVDSLTDWDKAYLTGLYGAERNRVSMRSNRTQIAASIGRAHGQIRAAEDQATSEAD